MVRFHPMLPSLKTNLTRRRGRTWQILGLVVLLFLGLTLIAVRYLPNVVIDPISVIKNRDFQEIFAPPIPRPPMNWPNQDHDHSLHLVGDQSRLKKKIDQSKDHLINLDEKPLQEKPAEIKENPPVKNQSIVEKNFSLENLTDYFSHMNIDQLQKIQSASIRREKVREVCHHFSSSLCIE